jgi:predicted N-acyltransferase
VNQEPGLHVHFPAKLAELDAKEFDELVGSDQPFLKYVFLRTLEMSDCVSRETGWQPHHFAITNDSGHLLAFAPVYLKYHSYGEYVFDWAWADAYQKHGMSYYPKLLCSIPFTPSVSRRILARAEDADANHYSELFRKVVERHCAQHGISSAHVLFPKSSHSLEGSLNGWLKREGVQYHWFNKGYESFDAFLQNLNAAKRKNIRKERKRLEAAGIRYVWKMAFELTIRERQFFFECYERTYNIRGQMAYLNQVFFEGIFQGMGEECLLLFAIDDCDEMLASALFFQGERSLYGRYWGALKDVPCLHFELCYYAGIERCIALGLERFDAGAQGEHKLLRGFEPVSTQSFHFIRHPDFRAAIDGFLSQEREYIEQYREDARAWLPYKKHD